MNEPTREQARQRAAEVVREEATLFGAVEVAIQAHNQGWPEVEGLDRLATERYFTLIADASRDMTVTATWPDGGNAEAIATDHLIHPTTFSFDEDDEKHNPSGEWIDEDGNVWQIEGWLYAYPYDDRPYPLMRLTEHGGDTVTNGMLVPLPDLINECGAKRAEG